MTVAIIEDESKARNLLRTILEEYCPQVTTIVEAPNLLLGVSLIKESKPDIVFLDIEMPDYLGTQIFDFLEEKEITFQLIFTTAYSHYAIKAFEMNAVDYLLKPIRPKQIKAAIAKSKKKIAQDSIYQQLAALKEDTPIQHYKKIGIAVNDGILFVKISDIICLEADGMYTKISLEGEGTQVASKPLKYFINLLQDFTFFYRPHRSFLINLHYVKQYTKRDGSFITLQNEQEVSLSRNKKEEFLELLHRNI